MRWVSWVHLLQSVSPLPLGGINALPITCPVISIIGTCSVGHASVIKSLMVDSQVPNFEVKGWFSGVQLHLLHHAQAESLCFYWINTVFGLINNVINTASDWFIDNFLSLKKWTHPQNVSDLYELCQMYFTLPLNFQVFIYDQ